MIPNGPSLGGSCRKMTYEGTNNNNNTNGNLTCQCTEAISFIDCCLADALGEVGSFILKTSLDDIGIHQNGFTIRDLSQLLHDIEESLRPVFGELNTLQLMRHIRGQIFAS